MGNESIGQGFVASEAVDSRYAEGRDIVFRRGRTAGRKAAQSFFESSAKYGEGVRDDDAQTILAEMAGFESGYSEFFQFVNGTVSTMYLEDGTRLERHDRKREIVTPEELFGSMASLADTLLLNLESAKAIMADGVKPAKLSVQQFKKVLDDLDDALSTFNDSVLRKDAA